MFEGVWMLTKGFGGQVALLALPAAIRPCNDTASNAGTAANDGDDHDRYLAPMMRYSRSTLQATLRHLFLCISLGGTV